MAVSVSETFQRHLTDHLPTHQLSPAAGCDWQHDIGAALSATHLGSHDRAVLQWGSNHGLAPRHGSKLQPFGRVSPAIALSPSPRSRSTEEEAGTDGSKVAAGEAPSGSLRGSTVFFDCLSEETPVFCGSFPSSDIPASRIYCGFLAEPSGTRLPLVTRELDLDWEKEFPCAALP